METILRTAGVYLFLLVLFRLTGKRTLSEISTFDFILLLIMSEATQNALIGEDYSVVTGMAVILTLVMLDLGLSVLKRKSYVVERITEGVPLVLVDHGKVLEYRMKKTHVSHADILQAARTTQGLERMDQIKYAVLEPSGGISVIPMEPDSDEKLEQRIRQALAKVLEEYPKAASK
ncbi:DUF421 domain-containing protein [Noviherbaspirillum massiliense]|uniref:DUF421 domain-containing protein n=1 Tax=Noviherbaspirillum massiliense TaxID=1465823 RepID=UPI000318B2DC|nr:YetF domain-containing protein [Noviherbaspirillum massiliense]